MAETDYPIRAFTITPMFAKKLGVKAGDIIITEKTLIHIQEEHGHQLEQLGLGVMDYLRHIFSDYSRIYQGSNHSILFVVYSDRLSNVAAIAMNYTESKWIVRTAFPASQRYLRNKKILYEKRPDNLALKKNC